MSGSSPSGNNTTLTFIPSESIISILLNEAFSPAASPSNRIVIFFVKRFINLICSVVSEVPEEETPAEGAPAEETPADETPADETPADEAPADEAPAEEAPEPEKTDDSSNKS